MQTAANTSTKLHHAFSDEMGSLLARELEGLLEAAAAEGEFQVRLARAHALGAIDVLTALSLQQPALESVPVAWVERAGLGRRPIDKRPTNYAGLGFGSGARDHIRASAA